MKTNLIIILVLVAIVVIGGGAYLLLQEKPAPLTENEQEEEPTFCAQDALECPDGSFVSRVAPDCDFAPCPETGCIKEGEMTTGGTYPPNDPKTTKCCTGLTAIGYYTNENIMSGCSLPPQPGAGAVCAYCGNGECGLGENKCNCPSDCL